MSDFILPEQLLMDIWLRLPIKSTVRLRCLSKSWCTSLSDPQFIYSNLTSFDDAENEKDLLMVLDKGSKFYSVVSHETLVPTPVQVSPLREACAEYIWRGDVLTFPCDDLVCFHNEDGEVIGVWNLTTGETKILPRVSEFEFGTLGFGFDEKIQDYKIVQIGNYKPDDEDDYDYFDDDDDDHEDHQIVDDGHIVVYVYSLRSGNNCWRKLDEPYHHLDGYLTIPWDAAVPWEVYPCYRSYKDGKFYWCDTDDAVVSFDMSSEVFNTISIRPLPHPIENIEKFCILNDESMLIISRTYGKRTPGFIEYELWALLEVGVSSSMTKLFHVDWHHGERKVKSLGFWRNELVFSCPSGRLLIGDPSSEQEPKEVQIDKTLSVSKCLAWTKGKTSGSLN